MSLHSDRSSSSPLPLSEEPRSTLFRGSLNCGCKDWMEKPIYTGTVIYCLHMVQRGIVHYELLIATATASSPYSALTIGLLNSSVIVLRLRRVLEDLEIKYFGMS